jgi:hypothetical protein
VVVGHFHRISVAGHSCWLSIGWALPRLTTSGPRSVSPLYLHPDATQMLYCIPSCTMRPLPDTSSLQDGQEGCQEQWLLCNSWLGVEWGGADEGETKASIDMGMGIDMRIIIRTLVLFCISMSMSAQRIQFSTRLRQMDESTIQSSCLTDSPSLTTHHPPLTTHHSPPHHTTDTAAARSQSPAPPS